MKRLLTLIQILTTFISLGIHVMSTDCFLFMDAAPVSVTKDISDCSCCWWKIFPASCLQLLFELATVCFLVVQRIFLAIFWVNVTKCW